jgi:hypothetical protein
MGQTLWMMGAFVDAHLHLERTLDLCAANQETITSYRRFGADDEVSALSALSRTLLILGYPEQAAAAAEKALARARKMGLAFTTALALDGEALLGALGADPKRAAVHADGRASVRAPCWPKAAIPNMGKNLCRALLQRSSAPIA